MFKILGADGKEYGPVAAAQLRQWIHEGRCGGATQARPDGEPGWTPLQQRPEFADLFQSTPLPGATLHAVQPVITTLAWAMFAVAGISALLLLANLFSILGVPASAAFHPDVFFYLHWAVAVASLPARVIAGLGLLRQRVWARPFAIYLAIALALYGGWGLVRMVQWWSTHPNVFPGILVSPMYMASSLWSLAVFAFNLATIVLLSRKDVRDTFTPKSSPAA